MIVQNTRVEHFQSKKVISEDESISMKVCKNDQNERKIEVEIQISK